MDPIDGWPGDDGTDGFGTDGLGDYADDGLGDDYDLVANEAGPGGPLADGFDPLDADFGGTDESPPADESVPTDDSVDGSTEDTYEEMVGPAATVEESIGPAVDPAEDDPAADPDGWNPIDDPVEDLEMIGTDPDAPTDEPGGTDWTELFPPYLQMPDLPEPTDGWPWSDAGFLGADLAPGDSLYGLPGGTDIPVDAADLLAYAAEGGGYADDPWTSLAASDDPATAALARFWAPGGGPIG